MKPLPFVLGLVLAFAAALSAARAADDNAPLGTGPAEPYELVPVTRGRVELRINTSGSIRPKNYVVVPAPISGKVEWVIDEGTRVHKGQEVARVDCAEYAEALEQAKLNLDVVEAELRRAKLEEQFTDLGLDFDVKRAELELERARLKRAQLGPPTPTAKGLAELEAERTKYAMDAADREYGRMKILGTKGVESRRNIALSQLKFEGARADHLKAVAALELTVKGTPAEDLAVADQQVKQAETRLDLAKKRRESRAALEASKVRVAEVAAARVRGTLELQQDRINASRVSAPVDGIVLYPRYWGQPLREGDQVWRLNRFLDVADNSVMTVEGFVNQVDWPRVKSGQEAEIRLVAYPQKVFHGVVTEVGKLARDRSMLLREGIAGVMSFYIEVDVREQAVELHPSYSANVSIVTNRVESSIAVPRRAVVHKSSGDYLWVKTDAGLSPRRVRLGPGDAFNVIVDRGLDSGDRVAVPSLAPSEKS